MAKAKTEEGAAKRPKNAAKRLRKLIKGARAVMLTTQDGEGRFRSRPMLPGAFEDGVLWFLTRLPSAKTAEIADNQRVNLAYASPKSDRYVSISGVASIVRDAGHVRDLWQREHKAWFPGGRKDPDLALLRVQVDQVEYWDADSGRMVPLPGEFDTATAGIPAKGKAAVSPGALG